MNGSVILFDGVCSLCGGLVDFVIARDRRARFSFAPVQSEPGKKILARSGIAPETVETIVLWQDGRAFVRSAAVLRIARGLDGAWPLLFVFIVVPRPVRDAIYDFIARRRYRWFGRADRCRIAASELRDRFPGDAV